MKSTMSRVDLAYEAVDYWSRQVKLSRTGSRYALAKNRDSYYAQWQLANEELMEAISEEMEGSNK